VDHRAPTDRTVTRSAARVLLVAVALVAAACTRTSPGDDTGLPLAPGTGEVALAALRQSDSCDAVADRVRSVMLDAVDYVEYWSGTATDGGDPPVSTLAGEERSSSVAGASDGVMVQGLASEDGGVVVTGSNDQEAGVAEGNSTVTDGRFLHTTVQTPAGLELRTVALEDPPRVVGRVALTGSGSGSSATLPGGSSAGLRMATYSSPPQLFLRSGQLVVVDTQPVTVDSSDLAPADAAPLDDGVAPGDPGTTPAEQPTATQPAVPWSSQPTATVTLVDTSDPAAPRVEASTRLEGSVVATRMVDDVPRIVLSTVPEAVARAGNQTYVDPAGTRRLVESITGEQVLPRRVAPDGTVEPLVDCEQVLATPDATAGADDPNVVVTSPEVVSVVSVGRTLEDLSTTTVQGGVGLGTTVYASPRAVYLTSGVGSWDVPNAAVHRIELAGDATRYTGSGTVPGQVLDQYSLSELDGDLRVVTTTTDPAPVTTDPTATTGVPGPAPAPDVTTGVVEILPVPSPVPTAVPPTEGRLTVLRPGPDGALAEVGHVDDLGVGERVQSVRFVGDLAYVVTFRQVDPLFAIDVSDPTAPRVLGELKIPGFSEYLHPLGDGRLLGVGVDADELGVIRGAKVSLFDVSDPTRPVETSVLSFPDAATSLRGDPLAFTWDPLRRTASFPLDRYAIGRVDCSVQTPVPVPTPVGPDGATPGLTGADACRVLPDPGGVDGARRVFVRVVGDRLELAREFAPDADGDRTSDESVRRTVVVDDRIHGVSDRSVWTFDAELRGPEVRTEL
jgi:hypothetical protein